MKRIYLKPEMTVQLVKNNLKLLAGSSTPPNDIKDYADWMGARKFNDSWDDDWEEE